MRDTLDGSIGNFSNKKNVQNGKRTYRSHRKRCKEIRWRYWSTRGRRRCSLSRFLISPPTWSRIDWPERTRRDLKKVIIQSTMMILPSSAPANVNLWPSDIPSNWKRANHICYILIIDSILMNFAWELPTDYRHTYWLFDNTHLRANIVIVMTDHL